MAPQGARARSQSAGRGTWEGQLMEAVASNLAYSLQFGSGGKGRRGETFQGKGKGLTTTSQPNPDDWICQDCGLTVCARKISCP
eukprot:15216927-Heterocapsa_arctica.AAC.1